MNSDLDKKLKFCLFLLRFSIFVVMLFWTLDKFLNPEHAAKIFAHFYFFPNVKQSVLTIIGGLQMLIILAFLFGFFKKYSYAFILVIHTISTFSSYKQYLDPWSHLLFFAAWPMLAGCVMLFLFHEEDTLFTLKNKFN